MEGREEEKKGHEEKRRTTVLFKIWSGIHKCRLVSDFYHRLLPLNIAGCYGNTGDVTHKWQTRLKTEGP